jgi:hypothetical protein
MNQYRVMIDVHMVQNAVQTDHKEVRSADWQDGAVCCTGPVAGLVGVPPAIQWR